MVFATAGVDEIGGEIRLFWFLRALLQIKETEKKLQKTTVMSKLTARKDWLTGERTGILSEWQ